jgi:hypothetical protein
MIVSMGLLLMLMGGVITAHLFGVRMFELSRAKLGMGDEGRIALGRMISEIRAAKTVDVGTGDWSSFTETSLGSPQQGTAIQIYPTLVTNQYVRYYLDTANRQLKRYASGASSTAIVARSITNGILFTSETWNGTILTNNVNNRVIGLTLQFYQIRYPVINIGPGQYYDFYQLRTRITRRTLE